MYKMELVVFTVKLIFIQQFILNVVSPINPYILEQLGLATHRH